MRVPALVVLSLATSACFATRNDVRILQEDIYALRTQQAQADSVRARQLAEIASTLNTTLTVVKDSVEDLGERLTAFQGATRQELYSIGQQLLQVGELVGQSQAQLLRFRADIDERNRQIMQQAVAASTPPAAPGDTTRPPEVVPPTVTEGPNVLYETGRDQLLQQSYSSAREAFTHILTLYPDWDRAADAQSSIAEAFQAENRIAEADSTYRVVFTKYPTSDAAPAAMYKLALSLDRQARRAEARAFMQRVVREYPRSDSFTLATDWLKNNP